MREIVAIPKSIIPLGIQGENEVTVVKFPIGGWSELYGNGEFTLLCERSNDPTAYPCTVVVDTNFVYWTVTSTDVHNAGNGRVQLVYVVDSKVAKSVIYDTIVFSSLNAGDLPDPAPEWINNVIKYGRDSEAYAIGTRDGVPVGESDPAYHNNSKWFAEIPSEKVFWVEKDVTTIQEIKSAIDNGMFPVLRISMDSTPAFFPLVEYLFGIIDDGEGGISNFVKAVFCQTGETGVARYITISTESNPSGSGVWGNITDTSVARYTWNSNRRYVLGATNTTAEKIEFDTAPTSGSTKLVTSGGIYSFVASALANDSNKIFWVTWNSTTPAQIDSAIAMGKLPVLKKVDSAGVMQFLPLANVSLNAYWNPSTQQYYSSTLYSFRSLSLSAGYVWQCTLTKVTSPSQGTAWTQVTETKLLATESQITTINGKLPPTGGTTGQVLKKASNTNYDYTWGDAVEGDFNVEATMTSANEGTLDASTAEIIAAYNSGRRVMIHGEFGGIEYAIPVNVVFENSGYYAIQAYVTTDDGYSMSFGTLIIPWNDGTENDFYIKFNNLGTPIVDDISSSTIVLSEAVAGTRYIYGELSSLEVESFSGMGIVDIMFESGTTPTVLTLPNDVIMPEWFTVGTNQIIEINILDGLYGVVTTWERS